MNEEAADPYEGVDNLEIMAEAVNYNRHLLDLILRFWPATARTALDVGAGTGTFAAMLRAEGRDCRCLEPDPGLRRRLEALGFPAAARMHDLADGSSGYIYSLNVLEHIEDHVGALKELHRALAPDGRIFVYVPAFAALFGSMDRKVGHVRRYTRASLTAAFAEAGFRIEASRYVDSLGFAATLAYNAVSRGDGDLNRASIRVYDRLVFPVSRLLDGAFGRLFGKNVYVVASKA